MLKRENGGQMASSPLQGGAAAAGDAGKELLRHLLKDKASAAAQATPPCRQLSNDSLRSEEEEGPAVPGAHNSMVGRTLDVAQVAGWFGGQAGRPSNHLIWRACYGPVRGRPVKFSLTFQSVYCSEILREFQQM